MQRKLRMTNYELKKARVAIRNSSFVIRNSDSVFSQNFERFVIQHPSARQPAGCDG
jgi:NDP-sugar pyrophosphorylase family protein